MSHRGYCLLLDCVTTEAHWSGCLLPGKARRELWLKCWLPDSTILPTEPGGNLWGNMLGACENTVPQPPPPASLGIHWWTDPWVTKERFSKFISRISRKQLVLFKFLMIIIYSWIFFFNYARCPNIILSLLFDIHIIPILPLQCDPLQTGFWVPCDEPRRVSVHLVLRHRRSQAPPGLALLPPGAIFWDSFFLFTQISYVTFSQPGSSHNLILPACFLLPLSLIIWISTKSSVRSRKWEEEGHTRRRRDKDQQ